jgi:hypothetical protein
MSPSLLRAIQRYTANHVERVPITTDDQSLLAHERDFERWRIALNVVNRLREAGIDCELRDIRQMRN